ncbi:MAG TPA: type II toxin-antitoxin system death-on-curing family toxin [Candidatus Udaeobacter sp.]|nr:type II toxin-antitoxin system death-on-curing family toxin [Candidatus Udaeobacter sp.]
MTRTPKWLSKSAVLAIHGSLLAEHGGARGQHEDGRLEAALASPINHFAHGESNLFRLAAVLTNALTRDHPFKDGNKRVALTACGVFLELNGFRFEAAEPDAVGAILALSTRRLDESGFAEWLARSCVRLRRPRRASGGLRVRTRTARKKRDR